MRLAFFRIFAHQKTAFSANPGSFSKRRGISKIIINIIKMQKTAPALLVLAAGMGSRYGGMKQLDRIGPSGETIMDYSVYDAIQSGFGKVVFVIRKSFEKAFREQVADKLRGKIEVEIAFQELSGLPGNFRCPDERKKPWGTGHAIWVAKDLIRENFAVINADDFYGREAISLMGNHLLSQTPYERGKYSMVGYRLENTLSEHGHVSRGVCRVNHQGMLLNVEEFKALEKDSSGTILSNGQPTKLTADEVVSMNFWGFSPDIFTHLEEKLKKFLATQINSEKGEFFIPMVVDELIRENRAKVKVLPSKSRWFGVTYKKDKEKAELTLRQMISRGIYPARLW